MNKFDQLVFKVRNWTMVAIRRSHDFYFTQYDDFHHADDAAKEIVGDIRRAVYSDVHEQLESLSKSGFPKEALQGFTTHCLIESLE